MCQCGHPSWFVESFFVFRKKSLALRARHGFWLYTHQGRWRRGEGAVGGRRGGGTRVLGSGKGGRGPAASRGGGGAPAAARAWARVGAPQGVPRAGSANKGAATGRRRRGASAGRECFGAGPSRTARGWRQGPCCGGAWPLAGRARGSSRAWEERRRAATCGTCGAAARGLGAADTPWRGGIRARCCGKVLIVCVCCRTQMRNGLKLIRFVKNPTMLDDAPWTWESSWNSDMPDFFQGMPNGVYDNIYEDLDDSPVTWHITEVPLPLRLCPGCSDLLCGSRVAGDGGLHGLPMSQLADTSCVARSPSTPPITRTSTSATSSTSTKCWGVGTRGTQCMLHLVGAVQLVLRRLACGASGSVRIRRRRHVPFIERMSLSSCVCLVFILYFC